MINKKHISVVPEGSKIILYKKGSGGEVVGIYDSVNDIIKIEKPFNQKFSHQSIYNCLVGTQKSFTSFFHGCRVRPVVKTF